MQEPWELHWRDYYFLLGLRPSAELEAVEGAAKQLLAKYHPDKSGTGDAERFKPINEAREVLTDPVRRRRYDAEYERRASKQKQSHKSPTPSKANKPDEKSNAPRFSKGVLIGSVGLLVLAVWLLLGRGNSEMRSALREQPAQRRPSQAAVAEETRHQERSAPAAQSTEDRWREEAAARRARARYKAAQRRLEQSWTVRRKIEQR